MDFVQFWLATHYGDRRFVSMGDLLPTALKIYIDIFFLRPYHLNGIKGFPMLKAGQLVYILNHLLVILFHFSKKIPTFSKLILN